MQLIQRGADGESATIEDVGVDLSGLNNFVAVMCQKPSTKFGLEGNLFGRKRDGQARILWMPFTPVQLGDL
jgi:hypothetical protein